MKKIYIKPQMEAIKMKQMDIICTSPGGYDAKIFDIPSAPSTPQVDDE